MTWRSASDATLAPSLQWWGRSSLSLGLSIAVEGKEYIRREQVMQQATLHALRQACQVLQAGEHQGAQYRASGPVVPAELRKQACDRLSVYKRVCVRYGRHGLFKLGLLDSCHMQPVSIEVLAKYSKEVSPGVLAPGPPQCHMCPCSVLWTGLPFSCMWLGLTCL